MSELLRLENVHAFYGESHILHGINLHVQQGEVVTLLGRNGAGRTTTLKAILGLVGRRSGSIQIKGQETVSLPPHKIAQMGIGFCPEERGIFASLTCEENLLLPPKVAEGGMTVEEIYSLFPNLKSAAQAPALGFQAASSRCSRWRVSCAQAQAYYFWMKFPKALPL